MSKKVLCPICECLVVIDKDAASATCVYCCARVTVDWKMGHVYATPEQGGEVVRERVASDED